MFALCTRILHLVNCSIPGSGFRVGGLGLVYGFGLVEVLGLVYGFALV
jgi:hypothetical protein